VGLELNISFLSFWARVLPNGKVVSEWTVIRTVQTIVPILSSLRSISNTTGAEGLEFIYQTCPNRKKPEPTGRNAVMVLAPKEPGKCTCFPDYRHLRAHLRHPGARKVAIATLVQRRRRRRTRPSIDGLLYLLDGEIVSYLWVRVSFLFFIHPYCFSRFTFRFDDCPCRIRGASRAVVRPVYIRLMCLSQKGQGERRCLHVFICEALVVLALLNLWFTSNLYL
jgi:hypothetical protein